MQHVDNSTVVVLGFTVRHGKPSRGLEKRLSTALSLISPNTTVVVTGRGEGPVMRKWLVDHGVTSTRIRVENRATSTNENLEYTRQLLGGCTGWTVVTSDFHKLRVLLWAWHHGYRVRVVTAPTPKKQRVYLWLREALALIHSSARVVWRRVKRRIDKFCHR